MSTFKYSDLLGPNLQSPYSDTALVYSTAGNRIKTSLTSYLEIKLPQEVAGMHIKLVINNPTRNPSSYSIGVSNEEATNAALATGVILPFETKIILLPCPANCNKIIATKLSSVDIIGVFLATVKFDNSIPLVYEAPKESQQSV